MVSVGTLVGSPAPALDAMDPTLENYYRWADANGLPRHYFIGADGTVLREVIGPV